jgi:hypothetical protein
VRWQRGCFAGLGLKGIACGCRLLTDRTRLTVPAYAVDAEVDPITA